MFCKISSDINYSRSELLGICEKFISGKAEDLKFLTYPELVKYMFDRHIVELPGGLKRLLEDCNHLISNGNVGIKVANWCDENGVTMCSIDKSLPREVRTYLEARGIICL